MTVNIGNFPARRMRRLRMQGWLREMTAETRLFASDLVQPVFITDASTPQAIEALPNIMRWPIGDNLAQHVAEIAASGIRAVALFPQVEPSLKNEQASEALNRNNLICRAIAALRRYQPDLGIIADIALDPYTSHGHDGLLDRYGVVDNDATVALLCQQAVLMAEAGASMLAPSDMMDGRVAAIRHALDEAGYPLIPILAYAAKYQSCFYEPFREAVGSSFALKGGKEGYQMAITNRREAIAEALLDAAEGADILMVKPALPYLDVIADISQSVPLPVWAYHVSGEYAAIMAVAEKGWLDAPRALYESLIAIKRAGASGIISYGALAIAREFF